MIGIAMIFMEIEFSFKLDLYFMKHVHTNIKNKMLVLKKNSIFDFKNLNMFFTIQ